MFEEMTMAKQESSLSEATRALMERAGVSGSAAVASESAQLAELGISGSGFGFDPRNSLRLFYVDAKASKKGGVEICELRMGQKKGSDKGEPKISVKAFISSAVWSLISGGAMADFNGELKKSRRKAGSWKKSGKTPLDEAFGKELLTLAWAIEGLDDAQEGLVEKAVLEWSALAREERWWLFLKADSDSGVSNGWRKALRLALCSE